MMKLTLLLMIMTLFSCASNNTPLKKTPQVDIKRFMGDWYVIANIPTFIEKGAHNAVETYTWNEKENRIDVVFTFNKDSFDGEKKTYTQKAFVHDPSGNEWRIQFLWPLKFPYLILDVDPDYSYTVIGVPNRSYVWIMARGKTMDDKVYQKILNDLKNQKYDISKVERVPQR